MVWELGPGERGLGELGGRTVRFGWRELSGAKLW